MNVSKAEEYFNLGLITYAEIFKVNQAFGFTSGWCVSFYNENNQEQSWDLLTSKNVQRVFASLDTLVALLDKMGMPCGEIEINFKK